MSRRMLRTGVFAALLLLSAGCAGLLWFAADTPGLDRDRGRATDTRTVTDTIVVPTGGRGRLAAGVELLERGLARRVLVTGVHPGTTLPDLLAVNGLDDPALVAALADRISLDHRADDTRDNAAEAARWLRRHGFESARLVTSAYHMRRALLELRAAAPHVTVVPHPIVPQAVRRPDWWRASGSTRLLATEFVKYLWALGRIGLDRLSGVEPAMAGPVR